MFLHEAWFAAGDVKLALVQGVSMDACPLQMNFWQKRWSHASVPAGALFQGVLGRWRTSVFDRH